MSRLSLTTLNPCHSGDVNDRRVLTLTGVDDLSDFASGVVNIQRGASSADLTVSLVNSTDRTVEVNLGVAPTDWLPSRPGVGVWYGQVEITFGDGTILTWPAKSSSRGVFQIEVLQELA